MSEQDYRDAEPVEDTGTEPDLEAPEADAAEQRTEVVDTREQPPATTTEADDADRAEQERTVDLGDDEYR